MSVFSSVRGNRVGRSVFNLSHVKRFTCDMGELIPALFLECVPGDTFKIGADVVTRFQPLVAPILDSVDLTVHYFFVPTRLLMDNEKDWETFLTGGKDGTDNSVTLPLFQFKFADGSGGDNPPNIPFSNGKIVGKYSLWDYFGLPLNSNVVVQYVRDFNHVLAFPQRAYNLVWNEFYRDENLVDEVSLDNSTILYRSWKKDYFTSALPWQQRGVSPAFPIAGTAPVTISAFSLDNPFITMLGADVGPEIYGRGNGSNNTYTLFTNSNAQVAEGDEKKVDSIFGVPSITGVADLGAGTTFDVATVREAFQIQRWLELNARAGVRYTEFLKAHFGLAPRDEVLQRPEYIGGTKSSIVVSEVLQTSATVDSTPDKKGSPQGNLAGHGLGAMSNYVCSYTAKEFGYIIGIASWMPKPSYQQGVNRIFSRQTKYDFYFPEFAHLSEQAVTKGEIFANGNDEHDNSIFGYQSCYAEMRYMPSFNCADMRDTFSYWHLGRIFSSDPSLNAGFLTTNPSYSGGIRKDIFADTKSKGLLVQFGNVVKAIRPLPVYGTPGFIDHVGRM
nr:MAG: major capsid protein [Microvirus sp.]